MDDTTTTTTSTSTTRPTTTTTIRPTTTTTTTTQPPKRTVDPADPVILDCSGGMLTVHTARPAADENLEVVFRIDVGTELNRIGLTGGFECGPRSAFTDDLSMIALTGRTEDTSVEHVVVIDTATGKATDLTAPRQGGGFSSGSPLEETLIGFVSAEPGRVRLSTKVLASSGSELVLIDPADPAAAQRLPYDSATDTYGGYDPRKVRDVGYGNDYNDLFHGRTIPSPDGRFLLNTGFGINSYITKPYDRDFKAELPYQCAGRPEGWYDERTVVIEGDGDRDQPDGFFLARIDDNGNPTGGCTAIFPPVERDFRDVRLRLDAKALYVTVDGIDGPEHYMADLANPGAEPVKARPKIRFDEHWRVFFPNTA